MEKLCLNVIQIAKETGNFIKNELLNRDGLKLELKGRHNYVTYVDKEAEIQLVKKLKTLLPEAGFITEEGTNTTKGEIYNWIIDPLDGTTNYIHGLPPFAVSVALMKGTKIVLGVIYEIALDECFYAWQGGGAFLNGNKIETSKISKIQGSLFATGFPYTRFEHMDRFMQSMEYFMVNSHGLRRLGSAATDIAYVACGRFEGFYEYGLNSWDIAAGIIILLEAGGKVSDFKGNPECLFGNEFVASNPYVFNEFLESINKIMVN